MSLILTHDSSQHQEAETSREQVGAKHGKVYTEIRPLQVFYLAEDYHQKYYLTRVPVLLKEMREKYSEFEEFVHSQAVARLNGYVGGHGTIAMLEKEIEEFALSSEANRRLRDIVSLHS